MDPFNYRAFRWLSSWLFILFGVRVKIYGQEHLVSENLPGISTHPGLLILANHQSHMDILVMAAAFRDRCRFFIDDPWKDVAVYQRASRMIETIPYDAGKVQASTLKYVSKRLSAGERVILFPEAKPESAGPLQPFSDAAALLLGHARVPYLPVAIEGSGFALPFGRLVPKIHQVRVFIGKPAMPDLKSLSGITRDERKRLTAHIGAQIQELMEILAATPLGKKPILEKLRVGGEMAEKKIAAP